MDSSLRKRFMSPFSISRSQHHPIASSPQQGQWSVPSLTPKSTSHVRPFKPESILCSDRPQEKGSRSLDQTAERVSERGPRQKVCRSLFTIKPTGGEPKSYLEKQSHQTHSEEEQVCKTDSSSQSDFLGTSHEKSSISLVELFAPEMLSEANSMDSTLQCLVQEELIGRRLDSSCQRSQVYIWHPLHTFLPLLNLQFLSKLVGHLNFVWSVGQHKKVEVQRIFDISDLLKPEAVGKFRSAITPMKSQLLKLSHLWDSGAYSMISSLDAQDSFTQASRLPENNERIVQMPTLAESRSSGLSINKGSLIKEQSDAAKSKEHSAQAASLCESMFSDMSTGKRRMIRGFSIPRCGRLTNQSYQEQAKEFQEILSSKVRQVAEVADCLQHTELLYTILGI